MSLDLLKGCELHVHIGGCLHVEDFLDLARNHYRDVDWNPFVEAYERAFGRRPPDPATLIEEALLGGDAGLERLRDHFVVDANDDGDFGRFLAKFCLPISLFRHWNSVLGRAEVILERILQRHRNEGLDCVEYRALHNAGTSNPESFLNFHVTVARALSKARDSQFDPRYIISLPRREASGAYALVCQLLNEQPDLSDTIVGLDFCDVEEGNPPKLVRSLVEQVRRDNELDVHPPLELVYHVGEVFFDKSLESAVRWCHEAGELGARRLGHAIALGMDPAVSVGRRPHAHQGELVGERLDQIDYDLRHAEVLSECEVDVDVDALRKERELLGREDALTTIDRPYTPDRLEQVRLRQQFVLRQLVELGTVIETCPTSNLRIGAVPNADSHPVHRFLDSSVNLVIGADDPGIFASPLAAEVDWVAHHAGVGEPTLVERLGDPRRFRLR